MDALKVALAWAFPGPRDEASAPGPASLALLPLLGLCQGVLLALAHEVWLARYNLPASTEALVLLSLYAILTGGRPWRGLAEVVAGPGPRGGAARASGAALAIVLFVLGARELVAIIAGVRDDISYPGAALLAVWPAVGRWGSALAGQWMEPQGASPLPFLAASSLLLALFFWEIPPAFFVAPAAALAGAAVLPRVSQGAAPAARLDASAGMAEALYLVLAAALTLQY